MDLDFGFVDRSELQDGFIPYETDRSIIFSNASGVEISFEPEYSIDEQEDLTFNAACEEDSLQLVAVALSYRNELDVFICDTLQLRIGQYRYATIQFNLSFELDPFDPLNPYNVVGINLVPSTEPYFTFAGCWYNWALDRLELNAPLETGNTLTQQDTIFTNVLPSQFCPGGRFEFVPGYGIISFDHDGERWFFERFE